MNYRIEIEQQVHKEKIMNTRKYIVIAAALAVISINPAGASAQQVPAAPAKPPVASTTRPPTEAPVNADLARIFEKLAQDLKSADELVTRLRATTQKTPEGVRAEVDEAANVLGNIADRLKPTGDIAQQLEALRNAATKHRKRVTELSTKDIDERDRQTLLNRWDRILQDADITGAAMADMKTKLSSALENLRMSQLAMSEMLLAGYHHGALETLKRWLSDLDTTVRDLHNVLAPVKPGS